MQNCKKRAFTLVELIVVITILAILWTIAFISLQWYSKDARDSSRITDLSSMKTSLEVFQLDSGKYPIPTDGVAITYSWATVWTQGTFWNTIFSNVSNLDKIPTDSLTDAYYTYSTTQSRWEYQLWWMLEWDYIALNYPTSQLVNAAWTVDAKAIVTGTYNWQITKSLSWSTLCSILSVPSIITNDTDITNLETINTQNRFVYTWKNNLPSSFKSTKFNNEWWFAFSSNKLVAYSDNQSCTPLTDKTSFTARVEMLKWIQDAYSWTILQSEWEIKNILALQIDTVSPSASVKNYAWNFVNNNFWWSVWVAAKVDLCVETMTTAQENTLNSIWSAWNIDVYSWIDWNWWYDYWVDWPFSKDQWCNNASQLEAYSTDIFTPDLLTLFSKFNWLNQIMCEGCWLTSIPSEVSLLKNVTRLSFAYDWLSDMSPLYGLNQLKYLNLAWNSFTDISFLNNYPSLNYLDLWYNSSVTDFSIIYNKTTLTNLLLPNNNLNSIPTQLSNLTGLLELNLSGNPLSTIPPETFWLTNLKILNLRNTSISTVPANIWLLTKLEVLRLEINTISSLPVEIWNLTSLLHLFIDHNNLSSLPAQITNATNLIELSINNNSFTSIPSEVYSFTNLQSLLLWQQSWGSLSWWLSPQIWNLLDLNTLWVTNSSLTTLPTELWNLTKLNVLNLGNNLWLWALGDYFNYNLSKNKTQWWMTIVSWGWSITISWTF